MLGNSVLVLNPTAAGALSLSGNASLSFADDIEVDSSAVAAVMASGYASVTAWHFDVVGGVSRSGNAAFNPMPHTGAPVVADPLAGLVIVYYGIKDR